LLSYNFIPKSHTHLPHPQFNHRPDSSLQPLQPERNFAKAAEFIVSAAKKGAQLAVLPEYHLTNWVPEDPSFAGLCAQWETYLNKYKALAKELKICIVPGTIVETFKDEETEEVQLHNIAYFIDHNGEVLSRYQKKNLWYPSASRYSTCSSLPS